MGSVFFALIIAVIVWNVVPGGPFYIFAFIAIAIISAIIISCEETKETQNITNVEVENITKIYNEGFENTGFSISSRGYGRLYYGKRKRYKGQEVRFKVSYSDKPTKVIAAMEGSSKYDTIIYAMERIKREQRQTLKDVKTRENLQSSISYKKDQILIETNLENKIETLIVDEHKYINKKTL